MTLPGQTQEEPEVLTEDQIRDFIVAAHGNLPRVREMLIAHPGLLNTRHHWSDTDSETAIQAAAQTGSIPVVEYLLSKGAPLEICTAAMLGRKDDVLGFAYGQVKAVRALADAQEKLAEVYYRYKASDQIESDAPERPRP